jgi:hypothetical protein
MKYFKEHHLIVACPSMREKQWFDGYTFVITPKAVYRKEK